MRQLINKLRRALRPVYGDGETEAIIRIIFHYLKGWDTVDLLVHEPDTASEFLQREVNEILTRLLNYEPIQYITGEARFHGLTLKVTPDVLIPRPETAELVDIIIDEVGGKEDLAVLDLCTGSGCISVALARGLRFPAITAIDISEAAVKVAQENANDLNVRIKFIITDIFHWSPSAMYDVIVSNPPYIDESEKKHMERNVTDYEPAAALFVPDSDPLVFYKRIAEIAAKSLNPGGKLYLEINPRHSEELRRCLLCAGLTDVEILKDSFGKDRFAIASKNPED